MNRRCQSTDYAETAQLDYGRQLGRSAWSSCLSCTQQVTASIAAVSGLAVVAGGTLTLIRARYRIRVRRTKGMRRGSPTQRQGCT